jgi:hypothetical protein
MDLETSRALLSTPGQAAIRAAEVLAPREAEFLGHFQALSRIYPAELARAALETAILRREAAAKFPSAGRLYFTREALEQSSAQEVSAYRVGRFRPFPALADLGCSIGGDTLAMAALAPTIGMDLDPLRLAMAQANARALGLEGRARFVQADLNAPLPLAAGGGLALFFDPARRSAGRRVHSVREYRPPLSRAVAWSGRNPAIGVKISPGVQLAELAPYDAEVEFISLRGELKEAALWFGPLKTAWRRATILPGPHTLWERDARGAAAEEKLPVREPQAFFYEPDPAVLRAGLVAALGSRLGAAQLDPDIAYLTAAQYTPTPFARAWAVEDWFPFQLKRLRVYLRAHGVGRVTVKKRGSPLQPEALIRDLRLSGEAQRVIFLTHLRGRPIVVIGHELQVEG